MDTVGTSCGAGTRAARATVAGKFLVRGGEKLWVRGVTYGTFRPDRQGDVYGRPSRVEADFAAIAAAGLNAIRTYTVPPRWLLDKAEESGLSVMVGLPWEQHVTFLDERRRTRSIEARVREGVRECSGHPAVLCYAVGNEIPTGVVRWHGRRPVERFLARLARAAREEDPDGLVTYVNYPSTEYLDLSFADVLCFNVYLETRVALERYLARLQNLAGERPLLMAEIGLDSRRNGREIQSDLISSQLRSTFAAGCAGAFVFSWTDEWHRGGHDVEDWEFGLVDRARRPKPALSATAAAFAAVPFPRGQTWPPITVAVCSYNGARTLRQCLGAVRALEYPNFELLVVDDGSTDGTAALAEEFGARVVRTENRGLASARNTATEAARGEIVAFLDDDAYPDPHWLSYVADAFRSSGVAGVGGPNLAALEDGAFARCVAATPGNPTHVLLSDRVAEHIPGCNMAFRRDALEAVGGFDPQFRIAGDDVDICWRLADYGWHLGFAPAAVVWHHRRARLPEYWRQQREYGRAEALLERKWPEKYNVGGHVSWAGRLYQRRRSGLPWRRPQVRYGIWGTGAYQPEVQSPSSTWAGLIATPEYYLLLVALAGLSALGALWRPLLWVLPALGLAACLLLAHTAVAAYRAPLDTGTRKRSERIRLRSLTWGLHLVQPFARLRGRLSHGLTPWRRRGPRGLAVPRPRSAWLWSESWREPSAWIHSIATALKQDGAVVRHGGPTDRWDLEVRGGPLGGARLRGAVEEHGEGKQLVRIGLWPRVSILAVGLAAVFAPLAAKAAVDGAVAAASVLGALAALVLAVTLKDCASAVAAGSRVLERPLPEPAAPSPVLSENGGASLPHVLAEQEAER